MSTPTDQHDWILPRQLVETAQAMDAEASAGIAAIDRAIAQIASHSERLHDHLQRLRRYLASRVGSDVARVVAAVVCDVFQVTEHDLFGRSRPDPVCLARHAAMSILHFRLGLSLSETGKRVGNRTHKAVINGIQNIANRRAQSAEIEQRMTLAETILSGLPIRKSVAQSEHQEPTTTPTDHA